MPPAGIPPALIHGCSAYNHSYRVSSMPPKLHHVLNDYSTKVHINSVAMCSNLLQLVILSLAGQFDPEVFVNCIQTLTKTFGSKSVLIYNSCVVAHQFDIAINLII